MRETAKQEWFETWFDTPYYHILYENRDVKEAEEFLNTLLHYLKLPAEANVLDAGCGNGRYSVFLADKGYNAVGIDLSWKNIQRALKFERENLTFLLHDMRETFYINYFDAAFNFFTSFGYFSTEKDNLKAIHSLSSALKPGGRFLIDFFNAENVIRKMVSLEEISRSNIHFTIKKFTELNPETAGQTVIVKKIFVKDGEKEFEFEERVQALRLPDFERYFQMQGLKLRDVFGDYDLRPFDPDHSDRMILIAEKVRSL